MPGKTRKMVYNEINGIIINMSRQDGMTINNITNYVKLDRSVLRKILKNHAMGLEFVEATKNMKHTVEVRNKTFSSAEQQIFNMLSVDNSLIQREIQAKVTENLGVKLSQPTISRKIRKINFTRKRLTLISIERI